MEAVKTNYNDRADEVRPNMVLYYVLVSQMVSSLKKMYYVFTDPQALGRQHHGQQVASESGEVGEDQGSRTGPEDGTVN